MLGGHRKPAEDTGRTVAQMKLGLSDRELLALSTYCSHFLKLSGRKTKRSVFLIKADPGLVHLWMDLD